MGTGTYVAPLAYPVSSAIFGRVGVVAKLESTGWKVFDATKVQNQDHYLSWAAQQLLGRQAALTAQSAYYNQQLRDQFRTVFDIDCVLFPPDQTNAAYTDPADVWINATDWTHTSGTPSKPSIANGFSSLFTDPRIAVLVDDEFDDDMGGTMRKAMLALTSARPPGAATAKAIASSYSTGSSFVRIKA